MAKKRRGKKKKKKKTLADLKQRSFVAKEMIESGRGVSQIFRDRRAERGGSRNEQRDLLGEDDR